MNVRVLLVDDEEDLLDILADFFKLSGAKTFSVTNIDDAISILKKEKIDVVLSDENMPIKSGRDLLIYIQSMKKNVPLFYFSTGDANISQKEMQSIGAAGVIFKPFDAEVVVQELLKSLS